MLERLERFDSKLYPITRFSSSDSQVLQRMQCEVYTANPIATRLKA